MNKGYWVARINIDENEAFQEYAKKAKSAIEKFGGKKVKSDFSYDSKNNKEWMSTKQLKNFIKSKNYNFE